MRNNCCCELLPSGLLLLQCGHSVQMFNCDAICRNRRSVFGDLYNQRQSNPGTPPPRGIRGTTLLTFIVLKYDESSRTPLAKLKFGRDAHPCSQTCIEKLTTDCTPQCSHSRGRPNEPFAVAKLPGKSTSQVQTSSNQPGPAQQSDSAGQQGGQDGRTVRKWKCIVI
ncbi:hypothetical protein BJY52DRAFT_627241 [Lactarius psammicola]|nr:hypothetical protein BJY52DRAFT_627241 [Lactarius psammicola]